ncbi:MAG TPA: phosphatase PAP2 family protein [Polyangiaceae bacterium]|nr:phosphatase PAP2 family protein [Polyangiaceae bacterium]
MVSPFALFGIAVVATWALVRKPLPALGRLGHRATRRAAAIALRGGPFRRWVEASQPLYGRYKPYASVALFALAGLGAALLAGVAFLHIAEALQGQSALLDSLDRGLARRARGARDDATTRFFLTAAWLGNGWTMAALVAAVAALLLARGRYRWAAYLVLTSSLGGLLNGALKHHYRRARPDVSEAVYLAHGYSFPSGHAMGSVVVFGALAYLALRHFRNPELRALAVALALCLAGAVSASRVYLGVHWLSDIGAGAVAGALWVVTTTSSYEGVRRLYALRRSLAAAARAENSPAEA